MALTPTATQQTKAYVIKSLGMKQCLTIALSPHKANITLHVSEKDDIAIVFMPIVEELLNSGVSARKRIIYCKKYDEVTMIYRFFKKNLGKKFTVPSSAPDLPGYRLIDMYTKCTEATVRKSIVASFSVAESNLRVIIATISFGMGIDCPNVSNVIHWGPSSTIEDYVQEIGRAGRISSLQAQASLYYSKGDQQFTSGKMMQYCKNKERCRRELLFCDFSEYNHSDAPSGCLCCDLCAYSCTCYSCSKN